MLIDFRHTFESFRNDFFEKKPLYLQNCFIPPEQPIKIIEDALNIVDPAEAYLKVLKNAKRIEQSLLTEEYVDIGIRRRRIRKDVLYRYLADDASLVLNRIDLYSPAVSEICMQVSRFAHAQASANAYVSFGREPATDVHWDRHDIFAIQLFGEKRWVVYEPTFKLPLNSQSSAEKKLEVPQTPTIDIIIKAGDVLYIPRGWWHRVTPVDNQPTFHLAVGAHTPLILDYLVWACGNKLPEHLPFRKSVNSIESDDGQMAHVMAMLSDILTMPETFQEFLQRAQSRERVNSHVSLSDVFLPKSDNETRSRLLQVNSRYTLDDNFVVINGQRNFLTPAERLAVEFISSHPGAITGDVLNHLEEQFVEAPTDVVTALLKRDIVSHILGL
ncbi:cupin domain-containing protein [Janthinobacterium sp.]|uniref:JmjC domain-containing protein n=1 Tax=Janthinobacterium sp. TaxID=1871054 RepID=UPI0025905832|nr:cupin domain-containing protein [Janthinobacterium sp.]MCX7291910.1 cupin-like domain-containing protein [Janthinobacterium sp.]